MKRIFKVLIWLLALVLAAVAIGAWLYVRQATPRQDGDMLLPGVRGELRIERDAHGIPTIRAASLHDAMYGLGIVHAQDRLWQLETHKRIGSGRLAEAFGDAAVDSDKFLRALGVKRAAERQWARTQGESRDALEAYAAGINDTIARQTRARPPEMMILGLPLEPWAPADSLAWATMMAWDLGGNFNNELLRMRLALRLPNAQRVEEAIPPYPGDAPLVTIDYPALYRSLKLDANVSLIDADRVLARLHDAAPPSGGEGTGSNNWVLAGSRTTTGRPLVANDPHLKLTTPALWYFVRLEAPGLKVAGATMPGLPIVVLGQNDKLAWGFTNTGPDVQDLYLERLDPADPMRYDTPTGKATMTAVEETIRIRGKEPIRFVARATRHGAVVSDAGTGSDVLGAKGKPGYALALRWTALEEDVDNDLVATGLAMMRADSVDAFVRATRGWVAPMQNMVVADTAGRIGFVAPGRVPVRSADNDLKGQMPAPGWEARYDWTGFIDADQTPREFDPPRGWIATANQRIHGADYPHYLTNDWAAPYRMRRIEQMLESRPKHAIDDMRAMQADVMSLPAAPLAARLQPAKSEHRLAPAAKAALQGFDGTMAADRAAPLIYWAWLRQIATGVMGDEMGSDIFTRALGTRTFVDPIEGILARDDAWWCDDKATPATETCAQQVDAAFTRALDELEKRFGGDVGAWRWGDAHQARSEHRPFSRVRPLARFFEVRVPVSGDSYTLNATRVLYSPDPTTGEHYLAEHGPSLRAVYDVGAPAHSRFMHSTGQSGLPWSKHHADFAASWAKVEYVPVWPDAKVPPASALVVRRTP